MPVERLLGAPWASAHGPRDPRAMLLWALKSGFSGLVAGPATRPLDWVALKAQRERLPFKFGAVRVAGVLEADGRPDQGLCSSNQGEHDTALRAIQASIALCRQLSVPTLILEPGAPKVPGEIGPVDLGSPSHKWTPELATTQLARRNAVLNRALDHACRGLHRLLKGNPDVTFCLTGSRNVLGLGEPRALALIFEDQKAPNLRYWHDAAIAARRKELLLDDQGAWMEAFGTKLAGMTLADSADGQLYLPPGAGSVDFGLIANYRQRTGKPTPVVVELDPSVDAREIPGVHAFLTKWGL